jgi:ferredoxin
MQSDKEGFLYPTADSEACIACGMCERVCPILNPVPERPFSQRAFLVQHKDDLIRQSSTSGGAFTSIAQSILKKGGAVFGAAFDSDFKVAHKSVESEEQLADFRNSKYSQSEIGPMMKQVKELLDQGRHVLFSGTPCQIEGLKSYLGDAAYARLITVDVVCRAVPSPLLLKRHLDNLKAELGAPSFGAVRFRDKHPFGYVHSQFTAYASGNEKLLYNKGVESDVMLRAFFSDICNRPSCYECKFKKRYRVSDFTIWDCFDVRQLLPKGKFLDNNGTTRVLAHSQKAVDILLSAKENTRIVEIDPDKAVSDTREMFQSVAMNPRRTQFFKDLSQLEGKELALKYFPETMSVRAARFVRRLSSKLGIYNILKKTYHLLLR